MPKPKGDQANDPAPTDPNATKTESNGSAPAPTAGAQKTLDLTAYRSEDAAPTAAPDESSPPEDRIHWEDLAGIPGAEIVDLWEHSTPAYGPYVGAKIRLPARGKAPSITVSALANRKTQAGQRLSQEIASGKLVPLMDGTGKHSCRVTVILRKSLDPENKRPMCLLSFGDVA
jgi:hypothetical protein